MVTYIILIALSIVLAVVVSTCEKNNRKNVVYYALIFSMISFLVSSVVMTIVPLPDEYTGKLQFRESYRIEEMQVADLEPMYLLSGENGEVYCMTRAMHTEGEDLQRVFVPRYIGYIDYEDVEYVYSTSVDYPMLCEYIEYNKYHIWSVAGYRLVYKIVLPETE